MELGEVYELSSTDRRVPAMEGMRGLAVILVFFVHFDQLIAANLPHTSPSWQVLHWAGLMGHSGVDLFFVLSGYLIYGMILSGRRSMSSFLARRVQRIYPTFLFVMAGYLVALPFAPALSKIPHGGAHLLGYIIENLLLLPGLFAIVPLITVAWSLSYEVFYYVALPLFCRIAQINRRTQITRVSVFIGVAVLYALCCKIWWNIELPWIPLKPAQHIRLLMFIAGILVWEASAMAHGRLSLDPKVEMAALLAVACAVVSIPALRGLIIPALTLFVAFGAMVSLSLGSPNGAISKLFSMTPLRWLGNMSYSYYLIHGTVIHAVRDVVRHLLPLSTAVVWMLLPVCFALTWLGSTALFVLVEKRFSFPAARPKAVAAYAAATASN